jgi:hypothetical protein
LARCRIGEWGDSAYFQGMPKSRDDDKPDIIPLPPVRFEDLPAFEPIGTSGFIRRDIMTRDELRKRYPGIKLPK